MRRFLPISLRNEVPMCLIASTWRVFLLWFRYLYLRVYFFHHLWYLGKFSSVYVTCIFWKGNDCPFKWYMLIVPGVLLSRVTCLPTTGVFESQKAKSHIEISLPFAYDFREFWAYRVCAQTTHIILSNTILRRSVKLSKTLTIFTSLCV